MKETADNANVDAASFKTLDTQPEKLSESGATLTRQVAVMKNIKMPQRKWHQLNCTLKELLEIFHDTENSKGKMLRLIKLRKEYNSLTKGIDRNVISDHQC